MRTPASLLALSLLLAACGGKVVVDPVEDPVPTCEEVCNKAVGTCGGTETECKQSCAQIVPILSKLCPDAFDAWLICGNDNPATQCSNSPACDAEVNELTDCLAAGCTTDPQSCVQ